MMSLSEIARLSEEMTERSAAENKQPYVFFDESEIKPPWKFPLLGSYEPNGWKLEDKLFCDRTGMGSEDEPALTTKQLIEKLKAYQDKEELYGFGIIEVGPFQLYIGVFRKTDLKKANHAEVS
jgi:hypothetical protein